jgi:YkoY family integral membrane protein
MEAESIQSLLPLLNNADQWSELLLLLPLLVALEAVLSADNAIALAAISRGLHDRERQRLALNLGLGLALVFRLLLIVAARWVLNVWPLQLAAALYLLWLCGRHLQVLWSGRHGDAAAASESPASTAHSPDPTAVASLASVVGTLAITDLAFSLDSVAAAVAVSDRLWLVMAGGVIGVIALRLTAGLFIRWLEIYSHLETAGFLAVGLVGIRLLLRLGMPEHLPPEWVLLLAVACLFVWGFSSRRPLDVTP